VRVVDSLRPMKKSSIKIKGLILGILALLICSVSYFALRIPSEIEKQIKNQFVSEDTFLTISSGSSLAEVTKTLGSAVRHQFTISDSGHKWTLIRCFLHTGEVEDYVFYQLLFCDDVLLKTIDWIPGEMEEVPYQGTTWSRAKPWDIEDMTRVRKAINARAVTHEQIQANLEDARATDKKYNGQGNIPTVVGYVFMLASMNSMEKIKKEYPINEEFRERYDGCRASLGMSVKEVDALYGEPLRVFTTKAGHTARIYGNHQYLENVDHFLRFSYVAVLFDSEENVAGIFSDGFFDNDWDPGMPYQQRE